MLFINILKISIRNIRKYKVYSILNISGLTIGITCSLLMLMYILNELSYDRYHKHADNIYRIVTTIQETDNAFTWAVAQIPLAEELVNNYPEVKHAVRFYEAGKGIFKNGEKQFYEEEFFLADSSVFDVFSYEFISGNPAKALVAPYSIVLTETVAKKYFDDVQSCLGLSIQNQYGEEFKITGIIKDIPVNSHFRFDALISKSTLPKLQGGWAVFGVYTYILLPEGYDIKKMYGILGEIIRKKIQPEFQKSQAKISYQLQRITDIHLYSRIEDEPEAGGDISYVYIFITIAIFLLIMASINYINLATASSIQRTKEVGIRKVLGSQRSQLVFQFIAESFLITLVALFLSLLLVYVMLPSFNELANRQFSFANILQTPTLLGLGGIVLFIAIVGGSYPALYLSGFNPVTVLKGKLATSRGQVSLRSALVIVQFSISVFMLISTLLVFKQLAYIQNKDLGFDKDKVIRLSITEVDLQQKIQVLVERLKQLPDVESVGFASTSPGKRIGKLLFSIEDNEGKQIERGVDLFVADFDFIKTMGMRIIRGRDFSRNTISDTAHAVIINEAMVKRMGWENPIGKKMFLNGSQEGGVEMKNVIGVIQDYHQNSLYNPIEPLVITLGPTVQYVFIRVGNGSTQQAITSIEAVWKNIFSANSFQYSFLDEDFDSQYKADEKRQKIFTLFTIITLIIACLGLLGLVAFTTLQRNKEMGVRKITGASTASLVVLIAKDFFVLVAISILLAAPAAWYFTDDWLQNFTYRIELENQWFTFVLSALLTFIITFSALAYHVVKAALANPIDALRDE
jgi:putative ABC transport system permease protein